MNKHFFDCWKDFDEEMLEEARTLLLVRAVSNNIDICSHLEKFEEVCDLGCGSGRYSYALSKLGAKKVTGFDLDVSTARKMINLDGVKFEKRNVLNPKTKKKFDFVFCNGVLHHTKSIKKGLQVVYNLLKPDGCAWIYLTDTNKLFKIADSLKLNKKDYKKFKFLFDAYLPANKSFVLMDTLFSKRTYLTRRKAERLLKQTGFKRIKFLERGTETDEKEWKQFGASDLRFWVSKESKSYEKDLAVPKYNEYGLTQWYWLARHKENLKLGEDTQIGNFTVLGCEHGLEIQDNVKIGYNCVVMTHSTVDGRKGKVVLKKNCRIGANSTVLPNLTVGENSIVGAHSLVNKSIPSNEVWMGSPARFYMKLSKWKAKKETGLEFEHDDGIVSISKRKVEE